MKNVRVQTSVNPVTGEQYQNILFDTKMTGINQSWLGETPNGKKFRLCTIETPEGLKTARLPLTVDVKNGSEVTVSATKAEIQGNMVTTFQVIGVPNGGSADASFFDNLLAVATPTGNTGEYEKAEDLVTGSVSKEKF